MRDPQMVDFSTKDLAVETIEQSYFTVDPERKFDLLVKLLEREKPPQAIVFCRTKRGTDKVLPPAVGKHQGVDTIHGDLAAIGPRPRDAALPRRQGRRSWWPPTWSAAAST